MTFAWIFGIPLFFAPLVYLAGRLGTKLDHRSPIVRRLAVLAMLAAWVPFVLSVQNFLAGNPQELAVGTIWLRVDAISLLLAAIVLTLGTMVTIFSSRYMHSEVGEEKYYAVLLVMVFMMIGLGCARDLVGVTGSTHRRRTGAATAGQNFR